MVEERISDGKRIAQLLASELDGRSDGGLDSVAVTNADPDVEPTADGARAYDVTVVEDDSNGEFDERDSDEEFDEERSAGDTEPTDRIASVFVQDGRARLEIERAQDVAAETARDADLRVRPKATDPPRTLVFVESGAAVKRAADVVQAILTQSQPTG